MLEGSSMHTFSSKNEAKEHIAHDINTLLTNLHKTQQPFLLLLSGGSVFTILESLSDENFSDNATITVLDERYSTDPAVNNMAQLQQTAFYTRVNAKNTAVIDTTVRPTETKEALATRFDQALLGWRQHNPEGKIVAILGIGPDGHTSGMLPFPEDAELFVKLFENPERLVTAYDADGKNPYRYRATTTNIFLRDYIDHAFVYAVGENKKEALVSIFSEEGDLPTTPARILREMKKVDLYTDITL
ncbi:MAG: 6-phosphogluconolactonase [Patescibacteria group bacterium]